MNNEPCGVKYAGEDATSQKSYTRDRGTVLVYRLLLGRYCAVVLQLAYLLTPPSPPVTELHKHREAQVTVGHSLHRRRPVVRGTGDQPHRRKHLEVQATVSLHTQYTMRLEVQGSLNG